MEQVLQQSRTGNFGRLASNYQLGRKGIPENIIQYLWSLNSKTNPEILDIGCGTGIPTRQLANYKANITAIDIDKTMIDVALMSPFPNIKYEISPANRLSFKENSFDIITIFSAFHWFSSQNNVLNEIFRVLKPNGLIFILNKNDVGDFWSGHRSIIEKYAKGTIQRIKKDYNPQYTLKSSGFKNINTKRF